MLKKKIKNILFIRTDRVGDFLLNIPLILNLKKNFSAVKITALMSSINKDLINNLPYIDDFLIFEDYGSLFGKIKLISELKKRSFDAVIISNPNKNLNWISFLAGIPIRIGYDRKSGFLLTHKIKDLKHQNLKHEIEYNLDLLKTINLMPAIIEPFILIKREDRRKIDCLLKSQGINNLRPIIVVQSQSSNPKKIWSKNNFAQACDSLINDLDAQVIFIGSQEEKQKIDEIVTLMKNKAYNLAGSLKLNELAALLKKTNLLISNDSGPMHIATFVQTPTVAIFGENNCAVTPTRWGPWGNNNKVIYKNLELITPKEVIETAKEILRSHTYV